MCYLKVWFFVILMVKVSQHPGKGWFFPPRYSIPIPSCWIQPTSWKTTGDIPFPAEFFVSTRVENIPEIFCQLLSNNPVLKDILPSWDFNLILAHAHPWYQPAESTSSKKRNLLASNREASGCFGKGFFATYMREAFSFNAKLLNSFWEEKK